MERGVEKGGGAKFEFKQLEGGGESDLEGDKIHTWVSDTYGH